MYIDSNWGKTAKGSQVLGMSSVRHLARTGSKGESMSPSGGRA